MTDFDLPGVFGCWFILKILFSLLASVAMLLLYQTDQDFLTLIIKTNK